MAFGEVGLLGELRPVAGFERRIREAARLGFSRAIAPRPNGPAEQDRAERAAADAHVRLVVASTLREAVAAALGSGPGQRTTPIPAVLG